MKKLLLTSTFVNVKEVLLPLLTKRPEDTRVAFIPTAADMYENPPFVEKDRNAFREMGFQLTDVHLSRTDKKTLQKDLQNIDVIFVSGGNTFYLLREARKSGFTELLPALLDTGVIYVGSSAGSYIVCPTIEVALWKHQDKNKIGLTDLTGMDLIPFLLSVHYTPEYAESLREGRSKTNIPLRILTDDQAIVVIDDEATLVGTGEEIRLS